MVAINWGYPSYQPWNYARRQVGNRLAQYIDAGGGGVVTLMTSIDRSSSGGDALTLGGRLRLLA